MAIISNILRVLIKFTKPSIKITWYQVGHKLCKAHTKAMQVTHILKRTLSLMGITLNINISRILTVHFKLVIPICHPTLCQVLFLKQWVAQQTFRRHRVQTQGGRQSVLQIV